MAHSVRRIIIIIRRTFTFTVSKITVILYLEKIGGAVEMKLLSIPVGVSDFEEIRRNGYYYVDKIMFIFHSISHFSFSCLIPSINFVISISPFDET